MKRLALVALTASFAGCQCGGIEVEDAGFECANDSDCIAGFRCIGLRCKPTGTDGGHDAGTDGGKTDGGLKDAGTDGGSCDAGHFEICGNGLDDDCNGLTDCADPACHCETDCSDGIDNDHNGLTDCADPNCLHQSCTTDGGHVCCGTVCTDLVTSTNCGGCGLACTSGRSCFANGATAACNCQGANGCPAGQKCQGGTCRCQTASDCAAEQSCDSQSLCQY